MAEATALRNDALNYPVYGAPYVVSFPILDADGDLVTGATGLDSEVSKNGDTFADCTNEATEIATNSGMYYLSLTATELTTDVATVIVKTTSSGAKTTPMVLYPRKLVTLRSGTVGANSGDGTTLQLDSSAVALDDYYNGCLLVGTLDSNVEARIITDYVGSTKVCTVSVAFVTTPDNNDTFVVYLPEGKQLYDANAAYWNLLTTVALPLIPTTPGTTLDVSATGEAGVDWANVGGKTTTNALTNTSIITTQKVDVETIKTNPVVNAGTITFPTTATLASTTNITAGTVTTATNVTTVNGLAANVITATSIAADAITAAKIATNAIDADAIAADAVTEIQAGLATSSALATVQADTDDIQSRLPAALVSGRIDASVGAMAANTLTASALATDAVTEIQAGLGTSAEIAAVQADTDDIQTRLPAALTANGNMKADTLRVSGTVQTAGDLAALIAALNNISAADVLTQVNAALNTALTDSIPADGALPSLRQAAYMIGQFLFERDVTSTTVTVFKVDGTTPLFTLTINSATTPTAITRAT